LVTGGTGFIGKNFISQLYEKKKFNIYSLSQKKISKRFQHKKINYIYCDLQNKKKLKKQLNLKFHFVVNFVGHINHSEKKKKKKKNYFVIKNFVEIFLLKKKKKKNFIKF